MRALLRRIGRPLTLGGRVDARMQVGIHSGPFDFFLVGSTHRELVVVGPSASRTVAMERRPQRTILLSGEAAALVSGRPRRRPAGRPPAAERPEGLCSTPAALDVDRAISPRWSRRWCAKSSTAGTVEAEHRHAYVGFVHFGGTDTAVAEDRAAVAAAAVEQVVCGVQDAAARFGVCFLETEIDADGVRIVLVAGAPEASENDEERMLRTLRHAFDQSLAAAAARGVNSRAGVRRRGRGAAPPDIHDPRRHRGPRGAPGGTGAPVPGARYRGRPRALAHDLRGEEAARSRRRASPPRSCRSVGAVAGMQVAQVTRAPLVGRKRELALLAAALGPARMGFGTLVEPRGRRGDREVAAARGAAHRDERDDGSARILRAVRGGNAVLRLPRGAARGGRRPSTARRRPSRALRRRLAEVAPELLPWIPLLAIPLDVTVSSTREVDELQPAFRRARLHGAVETLPGACSGPAALLLEDVHWMDEASSELLRHLAGHLCEPPWFVCATRRPVPGRLPPQTARRPCPR